MEQRTLRLGDIVDDYCPRERRVTNHAVVAIVGDAIRQTRCTTCEHEHPYKHAREPKRRKTSTSALYDQVLADVTNGQLVPSRAPQDEPDAVDPAPAASQHAAPSPEPAAVESTPAGSANTDVPAGDEGTREGDIWPAHRTLIRATLPKINGDDPAPRPIPEFTMHQRQSHGRHRNSRLMYGPQGDPFGRPLQAQSQRTRGGDPNGNAAGNTANAPAAGKRRRRRGKRRGSPPEA